MAYQLVAWYPERDSQYTQGDLLLQAFGQSLRDRLAPRIYLTAGLFAWIMIIGVMLLGATMRRRLGGAVLFSPVVLLWLTLLIATPLAFSVRYFFVAVFLVSVFALMPCILAKRQQGVGHDTSGG